jgi:hypothetical protein
MQPDLRSRLEDGAQPPPIAGAAAALLLARGSGRPIVDGQPRSVYPPIDASWFNLLALIGGIGALIATELGIAGQFALHF